MGKLSHSLDNSFFLFLNAYLAKPHDILGVLLGHWEQLNPPLCMDLQAIGSSSPQLPDCFHYHCIGNASQISMGIFSCRE